MSCTTEAPLVHGFEDRGQFSGGQSMGDGQVGDDHTHRYQKRLSDGSWLVITETYAAVNTCRHFHGQVADMPCPAGCAEPQFGWEERDEIVVCTDPEDVGGTEVWAECDNGPGSAMSYDTPERADADARRASMADFRDSWNESDDPMFWEQHAR